MSAKGSDPIPLQATQKASGYRFYRDVLGSPKYIVAPMVDQSMEKALKTLIPEIMQLIYTPMINAKMFSDPNHKSYRDHSFDISSGEGDPSTDRPLIVQFCANDPTQLLASARIVEKHCDAVDINLGCPQEIAKRGRYGAFLQDDWELIYNMINILHQNLSIPVTAKFRIFPDAERTVEYAKMLERAGAQIITCHGRTREQRGQNTGLADWTQIAAVKRAVSVPVFANGNILFQSDIYRCLAATGADAVMSAEGQLYNVALFAGLSPAASSSDLNRPFADEDRNHGQEPDTDEALLMRHPPHADLALEYLSIVHSLKAHTASSAVKGHLFKLMRPGLMQETDLRAQLGKIRIAKNRGDGLSEYEELCKEMKVRMERDAQAARDIGVPLKELIKVDPATGLKILPHWLAQPYFRPLQPPNLNSKIGKRGEREAEESVEEGAKKAKLAT